MNGAPLHYETIAVPVGRGRGREPARHWHHPGVFLISWVETSDMTLAHTMDLGTGTVHAFWTF